MVRFTVNGKQNTYIICSDAKWEQKEPYQRTRVHPLQLRTQLEPKHLPCAYFSTRHRLGGGENCDVFAAGGQKPTKRKYCGPQKRSQTAPVSLCDPSFRVIRTNYDGKQFQPCRKPQFKFRIQNSSYGNWSQFTTQLDDPNSVIIIFFFQVIL